MPVSRKPAGIILKGDTKVTVDLGECPGQIDVVLYQGSERRGSRVKILIRDGYLSIDPGDAHLLCDEALTFISAARSQRTLSQQMSDALDERHGHPNLLLADEPGFEELKHLVR